MEKKDFVTNHLILKLNTHIPLERSLNFLQNQMQQIPVRVN